MLAPYIWTPLAATIFRGKLAEPIEIKISMGELLPDSLSIFHNGIPLVRSIRCAVVTGIELGTRTTHYLVPTYLGLKQVMFILQPL